MVAVSVACVLQFQCQKTNTIREKNKEAWHFFLTIDLFPLLVRFSPLKYLLCEKIHCNYPLTTTQGDHFTSCESIFKASLHAKFYTKERSPKYRFLKRQPYQEKRPEFENNSLHKQEISTFPITSFQRRLNFRHDRSKEQFQPRGWVRVTVVRTKHTTQ